MPENASASKDGEEDGMAQVLLQLGDMRAAIIQEVRAGRVAMEEVANSLRREVNEKLASISTEVEKAVLSSSRTMGSQSRSQGSRARGCDSLKRRMPSEDEVPYLEIVANKDFAIVALMRCTMMLTVFSFVNVFPSLDSWVTEKLKENMNDIATLLEKVSGFSLLFFSVAFDDSRTKFQSGMGELWSQLCTSTIVLMMLTARAKNFTGNELVTDEQEGVARALPMWLGSFGGTKKATPLVAEILKSLERTGQVPYARATKRARRKEEPETAEEEPHRGEREQAVRVMRSLILRLMSTGRTQARVHIFRSFLFLVEKICSFPSVSEARSEGYEIRMSPAESDAELEVLEDISGTIWDIPGTRVTGDESEMQRKNSEALEELASKFPSLKVRLLYKRKVKERPRSEPDSCVLDGEELYRETEEVLSLHRVAMGVIVEMFQAKTYHNVLSVSGLALRTVHIYAIALRGLIRKSLGQRLSNLEKTGLGDVTFKVLEKNEELATVMLGVRSEKSKDGSEQVKLDGERNQKLEMSWSAYETAKKKRDEELRCAVESTHSIARQTSLQTENDADDDFDVSWMAGAGDN